MEVSKPTHPLDVLKLETPLDEYQEVLYSRFVITNKSIIPENTTPRKSPIEVKALIASIRSRIDRSLSITIQTPPLESNEKVLFMELQQEPIIIKLIPQNNLDAPVEKIDREINSKTQSERLRNTLYVFWQQTEEKNGVHFDEFYVNKMEQLIDHFKEKLHE